ncbi:MAG: transcription termination factor Rho [Solirubrobacteraceae bacterium]|nr:transcription termination factor Rho [Solirubrobacteraceae bacterium]
MTVLTRSALEASPLADLHAIASELGIDGFRRLRKAQLVDAIVTHQGGDGDGDDETLTAEIVDEAAAEPEARPRRRRGGRGRSKAEPEPEADTESESESEPEAEAEVEAELVKVEDDVVDVESEGDEPEEEEERPARRSRGRGRERDREEPRPARERDRDRGPERNRDRNGDRDREPVVEGIVELLANGSGFLRLSPPEPSDDDVYISAAQVRRCELVAGDRVGGPVRRPRRSERYPSLVRVDTINGSPADEVAEGTPFDELRATWPTERFVLDGEDPTQRAIEWLTPIGRGSRVTITGGARAGKTEALRRIADTLAGREELEVTVVLAGVRPEELGDWAEGAVPPATSLSLGASADAQAQAIERAVDTAKRLAARGGHAVVIIDSLDALSPVAARRLLAAARSIVDGGSLTLIASSTVPVGGETTVVVLDPALTAAGRYPALDILASGTLKPELLVGEEGARAVAKARSEALDQRGA